MKQEAKKAYRDCAGYTLNAIERAIEEMDKDIAENELMADVFKERVAELKRHKEAINEDLTEALS